jgi:uncharacterized Zn finger protein (UPF0148 family)
MGFLICCDNKGCYETTEALLEPKENIVYCAACGKSVNSVTHFAKVQMKTLGQTMKNQKTSRAFSVNCNYCGKAGQPIVGRDGSITCSNCKSDLSTTISPPMAQAIRIALGGGGNGL